MVDLEQLENNFKVARAPLPRHLFRASLGEVARAPLPRHLCRASLGEVAHASLPRHLFRASLGEVARAPLPRLVTLRFAWCRGALNIEGSRGSPPSPFPPSPRPFPPSPFPRALPLRLSLRPCSAPALR